MCSAVPIQLRAAAGTAQCVIQGIAGSLPLLLCCACVSSRYRWGMAFFGPVATCGYPCSCCCAHPCFRPPITKRMLIAETTLVVAQGLCMACQVLNRLWRSIFQHSCNSKLQCDFFVACLYGPADHSRALCQVGQELVVLVAAPAETAGGGVTAARLLCCVTTCHNCVVLLVCLCTAVSAP